MVICIFYLYNVTNQSQFISEIGVGITFVEFYSPSCGHCKRLAPTWEQLGKKFQNEKSVKIGKIDCTTSVNRQFCNEQKVSVPGGNKIWLIQLLHCFSMAHFEIC